MLRAGYLIMLHADLATNTYGLTVLSVAGCAIIAHFFIGRLRYGAFMGSTAFLVGGMLCGRGPAPAAAVWECMLWTIWLTALQTFAAMLPSRDLLVYWCAAPLSWWEACAD